MKKIVSLMVALALFTATAFATPLSVAASFPEQAQSVVSTKQLSTAPEAFSAIDETGSLFADVEGTPLTAAEADQVKGDGPVLVAIVTVVLVSYVANIVLDSIKSR